MPRFYCVMALLLASVGGCAVGRDFKPPDPGSLPLGPTTYTGILERFGSPLSEQQMVMNGHPLRKLIYGYAKGAYLSTPHFPGVTASRTMSFVFSEERLVGYQFFSSFHEDHTDFDESKLSGIIKGESKRQDVIETLGPPRGKCIFPLVKEANQEALLYGYAHFKGRGNQYSKQATIILGPNDVVQDINFSSSGNP